MIDVPVVQYFDLIGGGVDVVSSIDASPSCEWTRCYNAGAGVQFMLVAWSRIIE